MVKIESNRVERIRALNDELRTTFVGGLIVVTAAFEALPDELRSIVLRRVREFEAFDEGNDPHGEHDFVSVDVDGQRFFAKIDYYDQSMKAGSENPADPAKTHRVLTVMLAEDY